MDTQPRVAMNLLVPLSLIAPDVLAGERTFGQRHRERQAALKSTHWGMDEVLEEMQYDSKSVDDWGVNRDMQAAYKSVTPGLSFPTANQCPHCSILAVGRTHSALAVSYGPNFADDFTCLRKVHLPYSCNWRYGYLFGAQIGSACQVICQVQATIGQGV